MVNKLLEKGANPEHALIRGVTPLAAAVDRDHEDVVRLLLKAGADPNKALTYVHSDKMRALLQSKRS